MKYVTRNTAISLLEAEGASRELLEKQENYYINILLLNKKKSNCIHPCLSEPERMRIISDIIDNTELLLETNLSTNLDFKVKVTELVNMCNKEQLEEMYCKVLNSERAITIIKKETSKEDIICERTLQIYVNKLRENGIHFELVHDSISTKTKDDELCKKLLEEAKNEFKINKQ